MNDDIPHTNKPKPLKKPAPESREDRLRAALRANLARRKAAARGRKAQDGQEDE